MIDEADERRLRRILEVIGQIDDCVQRNDITEEQILVNRDVQWMLSMPLAEIGEQVYLLSNEFKLAHPDGEWDFVSGMRHRIVHNYEGVRFEYIAEAVFEDLKVLSAYIHTVLDHSN